MNREKIFIVDAKRSAIGKFLGALYETDPADVCTQVICNGFSNYHDLFSDIDVMILGNVISAGMGQGLARNIAIRSGLRQETPAYSVNMVCGSGMQAIRNAVREIKCGCQLVLCGGIELMSNIPFATDSFIRLGKKFGDFTLIDLMTHDGLYDAFSGVHMGITAENVADECNITREEQDQYAYLAQLRAIQSVDQNVFADEIVPLHLFDYRGKEYTFDKDEFPNRSTTLEKLHSLKPAFRKPSGTVTAGNSSGINDGAAFLLVATESYCFTRGLKPLAEIIDDDAIGCDPQLMGLGPYYAITRLLERQHMQLNDIDIMEINEAFAAQTLGCFKKLSQRWNMSEKQIIERTNRYGSGLGLGHPLGCTGARIVTTLAHSMYRDSFRYGIASLCIGGGMGAAILLKRPE